MPAYCAYVSYAPQCHPYDPLGDLFNGLVAWLIGLDSVTFWQIVGISVGMLALCCLLSRWSARLDVYTRR